MQQRQLRLGDILDDYCPRERRVTNHAVVAMVGDDVKQTRCTTCDAEHEYKHARIPRQRKKSESPAALYAQVAAGAPKRVAHDPTGSNAPESPRDASLDTIDEPFESSGEHEVFADESAPAAPSIESSTEPAEDDESIGPGNSTEDEGPVHRPLIRASLPRPEGQQPPQRPIPEFTIRQPGGGRPNRFRPRHQRGGQQGHHGSPFYGGGNRSNGNVAGPMRGPRHAGGGRPMMKRQGPGGGRKRSK